MTPNSYTYTSGEKKLLEAIPGSAAVVDINGNIVVSNQEWKKGEKCSSWLYGTTNKINYFEHCEKIVAEGNDYALRLIFNLRAILEGEKDSAELTIAVDANEKQWCKASLSCLQGRKPAALLVFNDETANIKAIMALRDSEEKYSHQFDHSLSGIIIGNNLGEILDANPAACQMLGYTKKELIDGGRSLIVNESDPSHIEMMQIRREEGFYEGEKEYIHKNGSQIPVEITSVAYRSGDGELNVVNTFRDKSVEKKTQYSLDEERRFSQTALNSIPGIFIVLDEDLKIVRWNSVLFEDLGYKPEELNDKLGTDLFHKDDREWVQSVLQKIFETGNGNFVAKVRSKVNGTRSYHFHFNKFISDKEHFLVATAVDKTEHLQAELQREKNFELMYQLFENSPLAMVMISPKGKVQRVNQGFLNLFKYDEAEVVDENVNKLITSESNWQQAEDVDKEAFDGIAHQQETTRITKDRQIIPVLVSTVPIIHNDEIIAVYGIYVDLREQKNLEKNLQKNIEEKDVLLQEVHHRVKNNLAIIAGLLDLQIIRETDESVIKKLQEVHSRVFSIAKIHETLYQQNDVVTIDFKSYLLSIFHSKESSNSNRITPSIYVDGSNNLKLNLNQAVPLSLAINELINIHQVKDSNHISIVLEKNNGEINLAIKGLHTAEDIIDTSDPANSFKKLLLDTFLKQLNANIRPVSDGGNSFIISFKKDDDIRGSSNALF